MSCGGSLPSTRMQCLDEAPSVSLYAIPIRGRDHEIALSLRIVNQPWSKHAIWLDSSENRTGSSVYWDFRADVLDEHGNRIEMWCADDSSPTVHSKYVILKPGEHTSFVLKPWCPGWFRSEQTLFFQTTWFDSNQSPPSTPIGAVLFRGPLVAPIAKYTPETATAEPDWSKRLDSFVE
jgi:hypothetical protein